MLLSAGTSAHLDNCVKHLAWDNARVVHALYSASATCNLHKACAGVLWSATQHLLRPLPPADSPMDLLEHFKRLVEVVHTDCVCDDVKRVVREGQCWLQVEVVHNILCDFFVGLQLLLIHTKGCVSRGEAGGGGTQAGYIQEGGSGTSGLSQPRQVMHTEAGRTM